MKRAWKKSVLAVLSILSTVGLVVTGVQAAGAWLKPDSASKYKCLYDELIAENGFIYGVNAPWVQAGKSMGLGGNTVNEILGEGREREDPLEDYIRVLTNCKAIGYDAVKIWLFREGDGIRFSESGDVLGFDEYFMDDFTALMDFAQQIGMPIDITLLPHQETLYEYGAEIHSRLTQFIVNPTYRAHYLERIVKPICELLDEKYRDTILSVTLYCEPEGDTYGEGDEVSSNFEYGTSWNVLVDCMNEMSACVRQYLPDVPVTATSGFNPYHVYRFNDVDLDIVGVDVYNNSGSVPDPEDMMVNKPMWLTEFGQDTSNGYNHSDDFHITNTLNFYENAKANGYTGAFYWSFNGYPPLSTTYAHTTYSSLRPVAAVLHYRLVDEAHVRNGTDRYTQADKPSLLYGDDPLTLQWIASRDAASYRIERSLDGNSWQQFASVQDANSITNSANICSYGISTDEQGRDYYYRVAVTTLDGLTAVSDPIKLFMPQITCSEDENLLKNGGFETGTFEGWTAAEDMVLVEKSAEEGTQAGNYCAKLPGANDGNWHNFHQTVKLKANTQYRITFYSKHLWDKYTNNFKVVSDSTEYINTKIAIGNDFTLNTYTFTTGDTEEEVGIYFVDNYEPIYIDSVYLFPVS